MSNPDNNPNEAYTVIPMPAELCGTSDYWSGRWTVTHNGEPVWHYPPDKRASPLIPPFGSSFTNKKMAHE